MQTAKSGIRVLGIAESFVKGAKRSVFAGIVMRRDLIVDGVSFSSATVGGRDATEAVIDIYQKFSRKDIHCIMLSGCVVSWFNIIDLDKISEMADIPVICVTYEESEGLEEDIIHNFPDDSTRLWDYRKLGERNSYVMKNEYNVFLRTSGISNEDAGWLCNAYIRDGRIPEPLRVARLTARGIIRSIRSKELSDFN